MGSVQVSSEAIGVGIDATNVVTQFSPIARLVREPAVTVRDDATIAEAVDTMRIAGVSALPVEGRDAVFTERDVARALSAGVSVEGLVDDVATSRRLAVAASMPIIDACGAMLNEDVRHLVVEFDGGRIGVVSLRDITAVLLQAADPHLWLTSLRVAIDVPTEMWLG